MKLLLAFILTLFIHKSLSTTTIIPPDPVPQASKIEWISRNNDLDSPKVTPINATTWDWWYFDVVQPASATGSQASIVVIFYAATASGFDLLASFAAEGFTSVDLAQAVLTWPNGTTESFIFNGTQARVSKVGDGASGVWNGTGAGFTGTSDLSVFKVDIDAPEAGIVGSLTLNSNAPAHYPCGPAVAGQTLQLAPHIGWANAIPDATANVDVVVRDERLSFTGVGYHDKNWGDQNFASNVGSWYWGHGHLGDYSVVWFDFLSPQGTNYVSSYVAKDNEIVAAQCSGVVVRPYGENSTYPPTIATGPPTGFRVNVALPEGELDFKATGKYIVTGGDGIPYTRWSGTLAGSLSGGLGLTGTAMFEQFNFTP